MKRREILVAKIEKKKNLIRCSGLIFCWVYTTATAWVACVSKKMKGEFISNDQRLSTPPWTSLRELEHAVKR